MLRFLFCFVSIFYLTACSNQDTSYAKEKRSKKIKKETGGLFLQDENISGNVNRIGFVNLENVCIEEDLTGVGGLKAANITVKNIERTGHCDIRDSIILGEFTVTGSCDLVNTNINEEVAIVGSSSFLNCELKKRVSLIGSVKAENTKFYNQLVVKGPRISLENCEIDSLIVEKANYHCDLNILGSTHIRKIQIEDPKEVTLSISDTAKVPSTGD